MYSLGATEDVLPWKAKNEDVLFIQKQVNLDLDRAGYYPIVEDGMLGGETCGAEFVLGQRPNDDLFRKMYPDTALCLQHKAEWVEPRRKIKAATLVVGFVLASAAAAGIGYWAAKKKVGV